MAAIAVTVPVSIVRRITVIDYHDAEQLGEMREKEKKAYTHAGSAHSACILMPLAGFEPTGSDLVSRKTDCSTLTLTKQVILTAITVSTNALPARRTPTARTRPDERVTSEASLYI